MLLLVNQLNYSCQILFSERMRNGSAYDNSETALKDKQISEMKKQLSQLKQLDHEYLKLLDQVKSLQSKYSLLQDSSQRLQNQHKIKSDITRTNISQLRNQLDSHKMQIHKYDVSIDEIMRDIGNLSRISENRENQITGELQLHQELEKGNMEQVEDNRNLNGKIQAMKEERNKCESESERLRRLLDQCINNLKSLQKEARQIEASNHRHTTILQIAKADHDELITGLKSREELVSNTNRKLEGLNKEKQELKSKTNKLEKQCIKSESDLKQVQADLDNGINRNRDLVNKLKNQEKTLRNAQSELDRSLLTRQALIKQGAALELEHNGLDKDIDRVMLTIMEMQKFNEDLQRELKFFIQTDEQARSMLNRKDAMTKMLELVQNTLHKTSEEIAHLR